MDGLELDEKIREVEDRVRSILLRTSNDDTYACQNELREAVDELRALRARRWMHAGAAAAP